ncbi:UNC-50, partial [Halteromyces radiatus]|uniref:UNC-50 n=1 Tax=Halteromyces radiatus TaxID=101107 RepID=UPI00221F2AAF
MSLLPTSNTHYTYHSLDGNRYQRHSRSIPLCQRLFGCPQLNFEYAIWQMAYLLIAPSRVYRNIYYHKQTKNQWARDDPAFLILFAFLVCVSATAWGLSYSLGFIGILRTLLFMIFVDFLLVGILLATAYWFVSNRFLAQDAMVHATSQKVEWAYAFDVHCNSFFPVFLILYVVQFFFMPLLQRSTWISLLVGNLMYFVSALWYTYGTFLGYNALPFLVHTELFLYPLGLSSVLFFVSLFGFNISQHVLSIYF